MTTPHGGLGKLQCERRALKRECWALCNAFAYAHVHSLPTAEDLQETWLARSDQLAALEMIIASYDPQGALFLDNQEMQP